MSVHAQAYERYRASMIETASPGRLLLMLYDAAVQNLDLARKGLADGNIPSVHKHLVKTQDIVMELMSTLNMEYEISKNLYSLYDYLYRRLVQANVEKSAELVDEVRGFIVELRDTWREAVKRTGQARATGSGSLAGSLSMEG